MSVSELFVSSKLRNFRKFLDEEVRPHCTNTEALDATIKELDGYINSWFSMTYMIGVVKKAWSVDIESHLDEMKIKYGIPSNPELEDKYKRYIDLFSKLW